MGFLRRGDALEILAAFRRQRFFAGHGEIRSAFGVILAVGSRRPRETEQNFHTDSGQRGGKVHAVTVDHRPVCGHRALVRGPLLRRKRCHIHFGEFVQILLRRFDLFGVDAQRGLTAHRYGLTGHAGGDSAGGGLFEYADEFRAFAVPEEPAHDFFSAQGFSHLSGGAHGQYGGETQRGL